MLTKGAIGNLVNRYKAVLEKCNLLNTFGSLAVASMLVLGGAGVAEAEANTEGWFVVGNHSQYKFSENETLDIFKGMYTPQSLSGDSIGDIQTTLFIISSNGTTEEKYQVKKLNITDPTKSGTLKLHNNFSKYGIYLDGGTHSIEVQNLDISMKEFCIFTTSENFEDTRFTINSDNINIKSIDGNALQIYDGETRINTNTITMNSGNNAIRSANEAKIFITANGSLKITAEDNVLKASANSQISLIGGANSKLDGNITVVDSAKASVDLGEGSTVKGQAVVESGASLTFGGDVTFSGNTADGVTNDIQNNGSLTINGNVRLDSGITGSGSLKGDGTVLFSSTKTTVTQASVADTLTAQATGDVNDQLSGDTSSFEKMGFKNVQMKEGLIAGEVTKNVDGTVVKKANTVMQDTLDMATAAPLAISRIVMNDVRKRMGDLRSAKEESGVWMRWEGGKLKGDEGLTNNFNTIQVGADTMTGLKNVRAGVAAAFTHGDLDHRNGEGENETFSFSAYGTWMADNGMFADVIARVGFSNTETTVKNTRVDLDNEVLSLSGEYGWCLPVCSQFFVEPQVELTYTYVSSADSKVQYATYDIDSVDSLIGRAGLVAGWNLPDDMGNVYARASVVREFLGDTRITGSAFGRSVPHSLDGQDTWLEYGIGANIKLTDKTYIWADVERTAGAKIDEEWRGTVGVRYSF